MKSRFRCLHLCQSTEDPMKGETRNRTAWRAYNASRGIAARTCIVYTSP